MKRFDIVIGTESTYVFYILTTIGDASDVGGVMNGVGAGFHHVTEVTKQQSLSDGKCSL